MFQPGIKGERKVLYQSRFKGINSTISEYAKFLQIDFRSNFFYFYYLIKNEKKVTFIDQKGLLHYPLNQYVFLLILSTLLSLYSNQYLGIISLLDKVFSLDIEEAKKSKEIYEIFLTNTEELKKFINGHQYIKGFQISTSEFYQGEKKVLQNIEEYIKLLQEKKDVQIFRKNSENHISEENSKNVEIIEGRRTLLRMNSDLMKFNEDDLQLVEDDEPQPDPIQEEEKIV